MSSVTRDILSKNCLHTYSSLFTVYFDISKPLQTTKYVGIVGNYILALNLIVTFLIQHYELSGHSGKVFKNGIPTFSKCLSR